LLWLPLLAAVLLVFLPSLGSQLVFDDAYLASGRLFSDYATLTEFRPRMVSYGSFVWIHDTLGEEWWKQRLVNILLHLGVVGALWALYRELIARLESAPGSGAAAGEVDRFALLVAIGFFALNPVAVYGVAYLIQRSIVMATLFVVLGLWTFVRGVVRREPWLFAASAAFYVLAVASKEHAVLAPLVALPLYVIAARPTPRRLVLNLGAVILLIAAAAFVLWLAYGEIIGRPFDEYSHVYLAQLAALDPQSVDRAYGLSVLNQMWLFFHYGLRWFLPVAEWMSINLRPAFPLTWLSWPHTLGVVGYVAVVAGGAALLRYRDMRALLGASLLVPALLYASEFATVWVQDPFVLYRSYLWAIGVPGVIYVLVRGTPPGYLAVGALVVGALLSWQALDRVFSLATPERTWSDAIAKLPGDPRSVGRWFPYLNRGAARVDERQYNLAMQDFDTSSRLGDMGAGQLNRGSLYAANGQHQEALAAFAVAEREGFRMYNLPFQRALSLLALGRVPEAYVQLAQARGLSPPSPTRELLLLHMGRTAIQVGRPDDAVTTLQQLLTYEPRNAEARVLLALAFVARKEYVRTLQTLDALPRPSWTFRAHYASALAHYGIGNREPALAEIDTAIRIGPDTPHLREWRGRIEAMK